MLKETIDFKQACALNISAWNAIIGLWPILLVCGSGVLIDRELSGAFVFRFQRLNSWIYERQLVEADLRLGAGFC